MQRRSGGRTRPHAWPINFPASRESTGMFSPSSPAECLLQLTGIGFTLTKPRPWIS